MAYELLNSGQVTPARLYAFVQLVERLKKPQRADLLDLLQPEILSSIKGNQEGDEGIANRSSETLDSPENTGTSGKAGANIYLAAKHCNLIEELPDGSVQLLDDVAHSIISLEHFRELMQKRVCNVKMPGSNNYTFNLYTSWYVVQNERVFEFEDKDFETRFLTEEIRKDTDTRAFNMTKFPAWRTWAAFLGMGWTMKPGLSNKGRELLVPDASRRLRSVIPLIATQTKNKTMNFSSFMQNLAQHCPELDEGALFLYCQSISRGGEPPSRYLSLALSTGLRQLHYAGHVELIRQADSTDLWPLYPADGHPLYLKEVTHIRFLEQNTHV